MNKRPDRLTALRVDLGINIAAARGTLMGAAYLCDIGIPIEVTLRVLLEPGCRRRANYFAFTERQVSKRSTTRS